MRWSCCLLLAATVAACGTEPDERPLSVEVLTFEILKPSCGQIQCHSSATWARDRAFDTLDNARASLCAMSVTPNSDDPLNNDLIGALKADVGYDRMPPDVPLAKQDQAYIEDWLRAGAPGLTCPPASALP